MTQADAVTIYDVRRATVVLDHADILALPTTPVVLAPAPGPDRVIVPIAVNYINRNQVQYDDVGSFDSTVWLTYTPTFDDGGAGGFSLGTLWKNPFSFGDILTPPTPVASRTSLLSDAVNHPVYLWHDSAAITGGDPSNQIVVTMLYIVLDV